MLSLRSFVPYAAVICVLALPSVEMTLPLFHESHNRGN